MDRNRLAQIGFGVGILTLSALTTFGYGWSEAGVGLRAVGLLAIAMMVLGFFASLAERDASA